MIDAVQKMFRFTCNSWNLSCRLNCCHPLRGRRAAHTQAACLLRSCSSGACAGVRRKRTCTEFLKQQPLPREASKRQQPQSASGWRASRADTVHRPRVVAARAYHRRHRLRPSAWRMNRRRRPPKVPRSPRAFPLNPRRHRPHLKCSSSPAVLRRYHLRVKATAKRRCNQASKVYLLSQTRIQTGIR